MHLRSVRLVGIRGFRDLSINLTSEDGRARPWTILIGSNGTGKTTLLRAIAIGLAPDSDANAMLAAPVARMVSEGGVAGDIILGVSETPASEPVLLRTTIKATRNRESVRRESPLEAAAPHWTRDETFLAAYGIARIRTGGETSRGARIYDATQSLFNYDTQLTPLELTLRRLRDTLGSESYNAAMAGIKRALRLQPKTEIELSSGGGIRINPNDGRPAIALDAWADGFRLNLAWIVDFFGQAVAANAIDGDGRINGILLLDEIEQHTHPNIQRSLVSELKSLWPGLQVVTTTHSPLVVLGCHADEVSVLKRQDNEVVLMPRPESFNGFTAEDILNDERLFDTDAVSAEESAMIEQYKAVAAIDPSRRSDGDSARLTTLARRIAPAATLSASVPDPGASIETESSAIDESALVRDLRQLRQKYKL